MGGMGEGGAPHQNPVFKTVRENPVHVQYWSQEEEGGSKNIL